MYKLLILVLIIFLVACVLQSRRGALENVSKSLKVKDLLRASNQWSIAAKETIGKDPLQALVHATSALALLNACRTLMSDDDIDELSDNKTKILEYASYIESVQRKCSNKIKNLHKTFNDDGISSFAR